MTPILAQTKRRAALKDVLRNLQQHVALLIPWINAQSVYVRLDRNDFVRKNKPHTHRGNSL